MSHLTKRFVAINADMDKAVLEITRGGEVVTVLGSYGLVMDVGAALTEAQEEEARDGE